MGLLTSEGDFWKRQRRLSQPSFHRQRIAGFATAMARCTERMLSDWAALEPSGRAPTRSVGVDVHAEMMRLTMAIVGQTLFSTDLLGSAEAVGRALTTALEITNRRFQSLFLLPQRLPTRQNVKFGRAMETLNGVVNGLIAERRKGGAEPSEDLLGMLMSARDEETGEGMNDRQLHDELMTLFLAGHETTANALAWTFYLLSRHPEIERRVHAECAAALQGRAPGAEDVPKLELTNRVVAEALRLYPPAWLFARKAIEADEIQGYRIPKGSTVFVCPYVTHRHPGFWENPEGFDPDRFLPAAVAARPRYAYFPFAGGPRQCIGNSFALMEATIILATTLQRYRLDLVPGQRVEPEPTVTLRPVDGVRVTLQPRA